RGAVVDQESLEPGYSYTRNSRSRIPKLIPTRNALQKQSPVGSQFIQPTIGFDGFEIKLYDVLCHGFSIISSGSSPTRLSDIDHLPHLQLLYIQPVFSASPTQVLWPSDDSDVGSGPVALAVFSKFDGNLKLWFIRHSVGTVFIRPVRF